MRSHSANSTKGKTFIVKGAQMLGDAAAKDIVIRDGRISDTSSAPESTEQATVVDGSGHLLVPGLVDLYSRCREPGLTRKGTIASESIAALSAGFTQVLCSPDTSPVVDNVATVELINHRSQQVQGGASIIPMAALTLGLKGEQLSELATLQNAGCPIASQADKPIDSANVLYSAMEYASSFNMPLLMTARDAQLGIDGCAHAGAVATRLGLPTVPVAAETVALSKLIELSRETGCRLHISRISSSRAVEQINDAKQAGLPVSCDVGIHHLFFIDTFIEGYDSSFHSRVPFRSEHDRDKLRQGLSSGVIDCISSDHSPHDIDASLAPFPNTEPGLSSYDWFIPLMLQIPQVTELSLSEVINKLHQAPHSILGNDLPEPFSTDTNASFFLLDTQADFYVSEGQPPSLLSAGRNNPLAKHSAQELGLNPLTGKLNVAFHNNWMCSYN